MRAPLWNRATKASALASMTLAAGCQLIAGIDSRSLAGDETTDAATDAGALPGDALAVQADGGADADASVSTVDAQGDGGFCASQDPAHVAFCDDFDEVGRTTMAQRGWGVSNVSFPQGVIVTSPFVSPPRAAQLAFGSDGGPAGSGSKNSAVLATSQTKAVLSMMVWVAAGTTAGGLSLDVPGCTFDWRIATGGAGRFCPGYTDLGATGAVPTNTWMPVSVTVEQKVGKVHVQTLIGAGALAIPHDVDVPTTAPLSVLTFALGAVPDDGLGTIYYDNVLVQTY